VRALQHPDRRHQLFASVPAQRQAANTRKLNLASHRGLCVTGREMQSLGPLLQGDAISASWKFHTAWEAAMRSHSAIAAAPCRHLQYHARNQTLYMDGRSDPAKHSPEKWQSRTFRRVLVRHAGKDLSVHERTEQVLLRMSRRRSGLGRRPSRINPRGQPCGDRSRRLVLRLFLHLRSVLLAVPTFVQRSY
jgi:hypothetical protein